MATPKQIRAQVEKVRRAQQMADRALHRAFHAGPGSKSGTSARYEVCREAFEIELDALAEMIGAAQREE